MIPRMSLYHLNEEGFDKALASGQLLMVDFWAPWCGPCQRLGPVIEAIAEDFEDKNVIIGKVNTDDHPTLSARYGIKSIPTVIFFKNGQEIERKIGGMPADVYTGILDANL